MTRPRSRAAGTPLNDHQFSQPRIALGGSAFLCPPYIKCERPVTPGPLQVDPPGQLDPP